MEMEIRRIPDGTDKVTALAELVYKYAGNLAEVNGADTGQVLLKAVARCMQEVKPGAQEDDDNDVIIVESTNNLSTPSSSTSQQADSAENSKKTDATVCPPTINSQSDDSKQTAKTSSISDSSTSISSKQPSIDIIDNNQLTGLGQKNVKDKSGNVKELKASNKEPSSMSTNDGNEILGKNDKTDSVSSDRKISSSEKDTDLDYEVIYLDDVNDLVNDKTEVVIGDENTPTENDKSDDYFDMDCDEIDENPAEEEEEEIQNTKESSVVKESIDEPDVMIIDDEDEDQADKEKNKVQDCTEARTTNPLPQNENVEQEHNEKETINEIVVETTSTPSDKAEMSSVKIEADMVPKLEEVEIIDLDSDSDESKDTKKVEKLESKSEEPVKPVSIVGFFTNKAKFAEDKQIDSVEINDSGVGPNLSISCNPKEQILELHEKTAKDENENSENTDEIEKLNAIGLIPIKMGQIPAKYLNKLEPEPRINSIKRSFKDVESLKDDSISMPGAEGCSSPKTKKRLLDFDKKWHMVPKYSPDQDKYLARPGGIEANVYNGDLTQHVMPAVNHMMGTEFRKPGLYTSFSSCAPNIVIETVNSNTPMIYNCHQNYAYAYNCHADVNNGEWVDTESHHGSRSQQTSRQNFKKNSANSAEFLKAKKDLGKSLNVNDTSESETDQYSDAEKRNGKKSGKLLNSVKSRGSSQEHKSGVSRWFSRGRGNKGGFGKTRVKAANYSNTNSLRGMGSGLRVSVCSKGSKRGRGSALAPVTLSRGSGRGRGPKRKTFSRNNVRKKDSSGESDSDSIDSDSDSSDSGSDSGKKTKFNSSRGSVRARGSKGPIRGRGLSRGSRKGSYANGLLNLAKKAHKKSDLKTSNVGKKEKANKPQGSERKTPNTNLRTKKVKEANKTQKKSNVVTNKTNAKIVSKQLAVSSRKSAVQGKKKILSDTSKTLKSAKSIKVSESRSKKEHSKKVKNKIISKTKSKNSKNVKVTDKSESGEEDSDVILIE